MKKILQSLLDNYLQVENNFGVPELIDNFFETYIETKFSGFKDKIEIYYLPLTEKYKIVKITDDGEIFKALISKERHSNSPEHLVGRIYKDLIITESKEEEEGNEDLDNEAELFFDSLSEEDKKKFSEKYNLGLDDLFLSYSGIKDSYQEEIKRAFLEEKKLENEK